MRLSNLRKSLAAIGLSVALGLSGSIAMSTATPAQAADNTITIGWTAWADAEFVTKLAKQIIEDNWDYNVKLQLSAIALQYQGLSDGSIDAMLMSWLPDTHADYWQRYKDQVDDLGAIYDGARLGWVVPAFVPEDELGSIEDLKKADVRAKLDDKIIGIDPGAGIMQLSEQTVKDYALANYTLQSSSGAAMTAALDKAIKNNKWIVVTGWTPHWMFGRWDLRFLEDPEGALGGPQHIDALVRKGFKADYPEVAQFLTNFHMPLDTLQNYMYIAQKDDYETAIGAFMKEQKPLIDKWLADNQ